MRNKSRLTITLSKDILDRVDGLVDHKSIRNRSHAIEHLLSQSLTPTVKSAVILTGGKHALQQPLLKTIGRGTLCTVIVNHLKKFGIKHLVICPGRSADYLQAKYQTGQTLGVTIDYSLEPRPLGTAGAIKQAQQYLDNNPFLVIHGDILTTLNLQDFIDFHFHENTLATIAVKPRLGEKKYGQVFMQGNKISRFLDTSNDRGISIINTGLYVLKPQMLDNIQPNTTTTLETDIFPKLAESGELSAFIFQGLWYNISTQAQYQEAVKRWRQEA